MLNDNDRDIPAPGIPAHLGQAAFDRDVRAQLGQASLFEVVYHVTIVAGGHGLATKFLAFSNRLRSNTAESSYYIHLLLSFHGRKMLNDTFYVV